MSTLNIGRDQQDKSYRYKMPVLVTKIEGRGNGIKTVIVNMVDIAKALHTSPEYPTKYFGLELGAQSKFDTETERAIVNGCHNQTDLVVLLDKFIKEFILCPKCKLPEVKMRVVKTKVQVDCAACGHNGEVASAHKLVGYIQKHQSEKKPDKKTGKKDKEKDKPDKKLKKRPEDSEETPTTSTEAEPEKKEKKKKPKEDDVSPTTEASESSENPSTKDDKPEDKKPKKKTGDRDSKEKKSKKKKEEDEGEWFSDTSKEAVAARRQAEIEEMKNISKAEAVLANVDNKIDDPVQLLKIFLSKKRDVSEIISELRRVQLARGLDDTQRLKIFLETLINADEPTKVSGALAAQAEVLKKLAGDKTSGVLISCLEEMVGVTHPKLLNRIPHILQALYEVDVLSEDSILTWANAPPESAWIVKKEVAVSVRKKATPFIEWLQNAEEGEEDEEDEDDA